jgi:hypothetical protein
MSEKSIEKLIKSLKKGELKAFTSKVKNKSPEYYTLFLELKKEKKYNNTTNIKNAQRRKYLYDSLLESLNLNTDTIDAKILKKLLNTETLFKRQLTKEAWKEAQKAQKLAQKHERFGLLIQILEWKKNIGFYLYEFTRQDYMELLSFEEQIIHLQSSYLQAKNLYMEILGLKKEIGYLPLHYDKKKISKFNLKIQPNKESKRTLFYLRMTKAIYYWMLKDHQNEYKLTKENIQEIDYTVDRTEYLMAYLEHLTSCICNAQFNELITVLNNLKEKYKQGIFGFNANLELKLFYYAANYELMSYAFMGNAEKLSETINKVEKGIEYWNKNLSIEMLVITYTALKMAYFFLGNVKKAKLYVNKILNESVKDIRKDAFDDAMLFSLLIVFENNDIYYQEQTVNKVLRYFKTNNMTDSFEYKFTAALKKNILKKNIFLNVFKIIKNQLPKYFFQLNDGRYFSENLFPVYIWLLSKIHKKPIIKIVEDWQNNTL